MRVLRFTLVADGASDRALVPVLRWLLRQHCDASPIQPAFSDLRRLRRPPRTLAERIERSIELYPCDLLFVHRDAETESIDKRAEEIRTAMEESASGTTAPVICVIPVRMQEAWLLIDEAALRQAAGNPAGRRPLDMPDVTQLEDLPDPKQVLHDLLRQASELRGRRLRQFNRRMGSRAHQVADRIDDFGPLRQLAAFRRLEGHVQNLRRRGIPGVLDGLPVY